VADYDRYLQRYRQTLRFSPVFGVIAVISLIMISMALDIDIPGSAIAVSCVVLVVLLVGLAIYVDRRAMRAPLRQLANRAAIGPVVTRSEAARRKLRRMKWANFGLAAVMMVVLALKVGIYEETWTDRHRYGLTAIGAVALLMLVQIFRKWRAGTAV